MSYLIDCALKDYTIMKMSKPFEGYYVLKIDNNSAEHINTAFGDKDVCSLSDLIRNLVELEVKAMGFNGVELIIKTGNRDITKKGHDHTGNIQW